jgi:hypothetical protein
VVTHADQARVRARTHASEDAASVVAPGIEAPEATPARHHADPSSATILALQRTLGNRAVQRMLQAPALTRVRPASGSLLQRFPAAPGDTDLDLWRAYLEAVGEKLELYNKGNDLQHLEVTDYTKAQERLNEIESAFGGAKSAVGAHRKNDLVKDKVGALTKMFGGLFKSLKEAMAATEQLLKPPAVVPVYPNSVEVGQAVALYKVDPDPVVIRLHSQIQDPTRTGFAKALYLTLQEVYAGVVQGSVDFDSARAQLVKLAKADSGTFSGVLAEFQGISQLLKAGELDKTRPATMGHHMARPEPFTNAGPTQDVDISYQSKTGVTQLIEVKDSVATLDTKMNDIVGGDAKELGQKFESRQVLSLAALREAEQAKGQQVEIKIMCLYPFGWVRFVMGRNCDKLLNHNITLVIAGKTYPPGRLRQLRDMVSNDLLKVDAAWSVKSVDPSLPKRTPTPVGNRHEAHWTYEETHKSPPD